MEEADSGWKLGDPIGSKPDFAVPCPTSWKHPPVFLVFVVVVCFVLFCGFFLFVFLVFFVCLVGLFWFFGRKSPFLGCLLQCSNVLKIISGLFDSVL